MSQTPTPVKKKRLETEINKQVVSIMAKAAKRNMTTAAKKLELDNTFRLNVNKLFKPANWNKLRYLNR
jgi:hypothetical protein